MTLLMTKRESWPYVFLLVKLLFLKVCLSLQLSKLLHKYLIIHGSVNGMRKALEDTLMTLYLLWVLKFVILRYEILEYHTQYLVPQDNEL